MGFVILWILAFILLVNAREAITELADRFARPTASVLRLSSERAFLRYLPSCVLMLAGIAIQIAAPWFALRSFGALLTIFTAIVIYRQWTWNEETFTRIQERKAKGSPDRIHNLVWLCLFGGALLIPAFGLFYAALAQAGGHFTPPVESPRHWLGLSFDTAVSVFTLDTGGPLDLSVSEIKPSSLVAKVALVLQKGLMAAMLGGAVAAYFAARAQRRDAASIFFEHPDALLRLGKRGLENLKSLMQDKPKPPEAAGDLGYLQGNAAWNHVVTSLSDALPPNSTVAAWIVQKIGAKQVLDLLHERLARYASTLSILEEHRDEPQLAKSEIEKSGRANAPWIARKDENARLPKPGAAEDDLSDLYTDDFCAYISAIDALTPPGLPQPNRELDNVYIRCASPRVREQAARYMARYAEHPVHASPLLLNLLVPALKCEEYDPARLALVHTIHRFRSREREVASVFADCLDSPSTDIVLAAARALEDMDCVNAIGASAIKKMLSDFRPDVQAAAARLLHFSDDPAAVEVVGEILPTAPSALHRPLRRYLRFAGTPAAFAMLCIYAVTAPEEETEGALADVSDIAAPSLRSPQAEASLTQLIGTASNPVVRERAVYILHQIGGAEFTALEYQLNTELLDADTNFHVIVAILLVLRSLDPIRAEPLIELAMAAARAKKLGEDLARQLAKRPFIPGAL